MSQTSLLLIWEYQMNSILHRKKWFITHDHLDSIRWYCHMTFCMVALVLVHKRPITHNIDVMATTVLSVCNICKMSSENDWKKKKKNVAQSDDDTVMQNGRF